MKSVIKNVLSESRNNAMKLFYIVTRIQRSFRAYLKRLIDKMEMMNKELEEESKKAHERTRRKTLQKRADEANKK